MDIKDKVTDIYKKHFSKRVDKIMVDYSNDTKVKTELQDRLMMLSLNLSIALEFENAYSVKLLIGEFNDYLSRIEKKETDF